MAQSMDECQLCGDMIDAAYAGICERCYAQQYDRVTEEEYNEAVRIKRKVDDIISRYFKQGKQ